MATCFIKTASTSNSRRFASHYLYMNTALFHSTPVWERRRGTNWTTRNYNFSRRPKKMHGKHTLLRNIDDFAECLFQSWGADDPFSSKGSSWFRGQDRYKGKKGSNSGSQGTQWGNYRSREGGFHFCYGDEEDVEDIFRSAFVGDGYTYWSSFTIDDSSHWSSSYSTNRKKSQNQRSRDEDEYDTYEDYNCDSESDSSADRLALGLSASGPLKLDDVKIAYRACALKYHPDRHQGSSKANAEEKFKHCSAAYQSLCDKLE